MSQTLLEISDDMQALDDMLYECGGILTEENAPTIEAWLKELEANLKGKADGYAALITIMEQRAEVRRDEAKRLTARAGIDERSADSIRYRLKMVMEKQGIKKLETTRYRISIAGNGGKAPLTIYDDTLIPAKFMVPQPDAIDKDAIRTAIDQGEEVTGAKLEERGTSLRIK